MLRAVGRGLGGAAGGGAEGSGAGLVAKACLSDVVAATAWGHKAFRVPLDRLVYFPSIQPHSTFFLTINLLGCKSSRTVLTSQNLLAKKQCQGLHVPKPTCQKSDHVSSQVSLNIV